jgi:hypothetical protein
LHLTDEDRSKIESSLLPARFGGRFRFANPARCQQCSSEISGPMLRTVSYLVFDGSLVTDAAPDKMGFKFALAGTA